MTEEESLKIEYFLLINQSLLDVVDTYVEVFMPIYLMHSKVGVY